MTVPVPGVTAVAQWQSHVLSCQICAQSRTIGDMCQIGQNFWRPAGHAPEPSRPQALAPVPSVQELARRVCSTVVARSMGGASVHVPMQKHSKGVEFSTAPGVVMSMPERDVEVYSAMKALIARIAAVAQRMAHAVTIESEAKSHVGRSGVSQEEESQTLALVVSESRRNLGIGDDSDIYTEFSGITRDILDLSDRLGNFMQVDSDTRQIMQKGRRLAIVMQEALETAGSGSITLDHNMRKIVSQMRFFAIDLQGEMERRLGTP